jgi:lipoate-protein ligase A
VNEIAEVSTGLLIFDAPAEGAWNMAVDEALLLDAARNARATLRFYHWSERTLSLGYFQRYADRYHHEASRNCALVRRQTGGGAILHDRELTYSIVLPPNHLLAKQSQQLYRTVHREFIHALLELSAPGLAGWKFQIREPAQSQSTAEEPFLCFQRKAEGDVIAIRAGAQPAECKILGSAQRRFRGAVLQHGSLILERSPAAPELPGLRDCVGLSVATNALTDRISERLANALELTISRAEFSPELESLASELANTRYGSAIWTNRR